MLDDTDSMHGESGGLFATPWPQAEGGLGMDGADEAMEGEYDDPWLLAWFEYELPESQPRMVVMPSAMGWAIPPQAYALSPLPMAMTQQPLANAVESGSTTQTEASFSIAIRAVAWPDRAVMPGVVVEAESQQPEVLATLGADGSASVSGLMGGELSLRVTLPLDDLEQAQANAAVNLRDALAVMRLLSAPARSSEFPLPAGQPPSLTMAATRWAADFDGNGAVSLADAVGILRHAVGLPATRPSWVFFDEHAVGVEGSSPGAPGPVPSIAVNVGVDVASSLVGVLRGDVDGSFGRGRFGLSSIDGGGLYAVNASPGDVRLGAGGGDLVLTASDGSVARSPSSTLTGLRFDDIQLLGDVAALSELQDGAVLLGSGQAGVAIEVHTLEQTRQLVAAWTGLSTVAGLVPDLSVKVVVADGQPDATQVRLSMDAALLEDAYAITAAVGTAVRMVQSDGTVLLGAPWIDIASVSDTGPSNSDDVSRVTAPVLEVWLPNVPGALAAEGDVLTVLLDGQLWSSVALSPADAATQRVTLTVPELGADGLKVLRAVLDAGGDHAALGLPSNEIRYRLDATAPPPPTVDLVAGNDVLDAAERAALSDGSAVVISGTATPGNTVQLQMAALGESTPSLSSTVSTLVDTQGRWAFSADQVSWPGGLAVPQAGTHEVRIAALDDVGNVSSMVSRTFVVETVPTFGVVVEGSVVRFTGSANGTLFVNVNAAGTATFSREVLGMSEVVSAPTTVTGLFSKSLVDVQSLSIQIAPADSSTQHVFNAPSATSLVLRGSSGGGIDEIVIRIKDQQPGTYNAQVLHLDTGSFTATGDTLTFRFEESARNVLTNPLDNDRLTLSPSTVIAEGFARLKVVAGMVDVSQISPLQGGYLPPNKDWEIGSGVVMSLDQLLTTSSVVSPTETGGLIVEITSDRQDDLAAWLADESAMVDLWGVTAGVSIDGLLGPLFPT